MNSRRRVLIAPVRPRNRSLSMTPNTKDFLQKICYKKTASVDMTNFGFINDSKVSPVNLLMRPLREKLEDIFDARPERPVRRKTKPQLVSETVIKLKKTFAHDVTPKRRVHYADE